MINAHRCSSGHQAHIQGTRPESNVRDSDFLDDDDDDDYEDDDDEDLEFGLVLANIEDI